VGYSEEADPLQEKSGSSEYLRHRRLWLKWVLKPLLSDVIARDPKFSYHVVIWLIGSATVSWRSRKYDISKSRVKTRWGLGFIYIFNCFVVSSG
jgi:hypothetical protein